MDERTANQALPNVDTIVQSKLFQDYWYYAIELFPGVFTPGQRHKNITITRKLLTRCGVEGANCLDIGTMEAMVPVLLKRRNAQKVCAVDMLNFTDKIDLVQRCTGANFDYYPETRLEHTVDFLDRRGLTGFDLVTLSGVLYHVFDPMHTLGVARSMVRTGGIVLIETAAAAEDTAAMYYNDAGRHYFDWTSFWFISVPCLDAMLRYYKLAPIDCLYLQPEQLGGINVCRIAVACRAVEDCLPLPHDRWMRDATRTFDYTGAIRWDVQQKSLRRDPHPYDERAAAALPRHAGVGTCDLRAVMHACRPYEYQASELQLGSTDTY
jgi:SAM-dependent methyltransferase